jgi:hypothetical protein
MRQNRINHKQNKRTLANMAKSGVELVFFLSLFAILYIEFWGIA